jgi:hypothetical protein
VGGQIHVGGGGVMAKSQKPGETPKILEEFLSQPIDGLVLKKLSLASLSWLKTNEENVNALNIFPVADFDAGTNMVATMQSAYGEIANLSKQSASDVVQNLAHGALMGARGNSGVILSQFWRGFHRGLRDDNIITGRSLANALSEARDTAYKGVLRPVEGTILTVIKDMASAAEKVQGEISNPFELLDIVIKEADASVKRTPDLLPILKQNGKVDAGGKGLFYIMEGMLRLAQGLPQDTAIDNFQSFSMRHKIEKTAKVFISYARIDVDAVQVIYNGLLKENHYPWMDIHNIKGGENWLRAIYKAIKESEIFVAVLSHNSVSRRGVIQKELKKALDKWEGMLPDDIYIIPVRLDDCPIPELLKDFHVIDWEDGKGKDKLLEAIQVGLERRQKG